MHTYISHPRRLLRNTLRNVSAAVHHHLRQLRGVCYVQLYERAEQLVRAWMAGPSDADDGVATISYTWSRNSPPALHGPARAPWQAGSMKRVMRLGEILGCLEVTVGGREAARDRGQAQVESTRRGNESRKGAPENRTCAAARSEFRAESYLAIMLARLALPAGPSYNGLNGYTSAV